MNDYKELIGKLRHYADTADENIYGLCINSPKAMLQAADAIEQLVKERDAAIAVVTEIANTDYCHNFQNGDFWVVDFINRITQIQKKAKALSLKRYDLCDQYEEGVQE